MYVNAFLKSVVSGSALAKVGRTAIKDGCYVDISDINRYELHKVPFCREINSVKLRDELIRKIEKFDDTGKVISTITKILTEKD